MLELLLSLISVAYPMYTTVICIERGEDLTEWTIYWLSYGVVSWLYEILGFLLSWIPLLWILKFMFVSWLIHPRTKGSLIMYKCIIRIWWHHENWLKDKNKYAKKLKDMNQNECAIFNKSQNYLENYYDWFKHIKNQAKSKVLFLFRFLK